MKASDQLNILRGSGAGGVVVSFLALVLILLVPPMFMIPIGTRYYAGAVGAVVGVVAGAIMERYERVAMRQLADKFYAEVRRFMAAAAEQPKRFAV